MRLKIASMEEVCSFLESHSEDPASELELLIKQARADETITKGQAMIVRHNKAVRQRLPIPGYEEKSQAALAREYNVSRGTIGIRTYTTFDVLAGYLWQYVPKDGLGSLDIRYLPWAKYDVSANGKRACLRLIDEIQGTKSLQSQGQEPVSVQDVVEYFSSLKQSGKRISIIQYGVKSYQTTRSVFEEIGFPLPALEVVKLY